MEKVKPVFLGIGSNVGNRIGHVRWGVRALARQHQVDVETCSSVFESEAHTLDSGELQRSYLNAVVSCTTTLSPRALLQLCLSLEKDRGRIREPEHRWRPRTLDIDILAYADWCITDPDLAIPHPLLGHRNFVLEPWTEIAPDFVVPAPFKKSVTALLEKSNDTGVLKKTSYQLLD